MLLSKLSNRNPIIGAEILGKSHKLRELSDIVLMHHERFDGKGYPIGKAGADIPIGARIIAICDSIDAISFTAVIVKHIILITVMRK